METAAVLRPKAISYGMYLNDLNSPPRAYNGPSIHLSKSLKTLLSLGVRVWLVSRQGGKPVVEQDATQTPL